MTIPQSERRSPFHPDRDALGRWFRFRKEWGIDDSILIGRLPNHSDQVQWQSYAHEHYDGIGAFAHALAQQGYRVTELPRNTRIETPSLRRKLKTLIKPMGKQALPQTLWRQFHEPEFPLLQTNDSPEQSVDDLGQDIAWQVLSIQESERLEARAQSQNVSINSYLFWGLNRAIGSRFIKAECQYSWFYPINLRSDWFRNNNVLANHSTGIYFNTHANANAESIHSAIKAQLEYGGHYGLFYQGHLGLLLGDAVAQRLYRPALKQRMTGSLSAIGQWPPAPEDQEKAGREAWLLCAPGSPMYPISTGVIHWLNRYTICLKINPCLSVAWGETPRHLADAALTHWLQLCLDE